MLDQSTLTTSLNQCTTPLPLLTYLTSTLSADNASLRPFSTFTPAIYDTAWLSMVHRASPDGNGKIEWLFPYCWTYILDTQLEDGSWPSYAAPIDGILNTLASLLALLTRQKKCSPQSDVAPLLAERITSAIHGLQRLLDVWDIASAVHVGFEVLVPRLLHQLSSVHNVQLSFAAQPKLDALYANKIRKFRPEMVYADVSTTLIHLLEALVGMLDFDRVRHHCSSRNGLFGLPAATAAYLMNVGVWDEGAEKYLRSVVACYGGAVPSAFPTETFEVSWVSWLRRPTVLHSLG
jgi:hypothetical protein